MCPGHDDLVGLRCIDPSLYGPHELCVGLLVWGTGTGHLDGSISDLCLLHDGPSDFDADFDPRIAHADHDRDLYSHLDLHTNFDPDSYIGSVHSDVHPDPGPDADRDRGFDL